MESLGSCTECGLQAVRVEIGRFSGTLSKGSPRECGVTENSGTLHVFYAPTQWSCRSVKYGSELSQLSNWEGPATGRREDEGLGENSRGPPGAIVWTTGLVTPTRLPGAFVFIKVWAEDVPRRLQFRSRST